MTTKFLITMPFPDMAKLNPHPKGKVGAMWRKVRETKSQREMAGILALQARLNAKADRCKSKRKLSVYIYVPDDNVRDTLNILSCMKGAVDGLTDGGLIEDDSWQKLTIAAVCVEVCKENPRVELVIE